MLIRLPKAAQTRVIFIELEAIYTLGRGVFNLRNSSLASASFLGE
jgi:hypothetical protein